MEFLSEKKPEKLMNLIDSYVEFKDYVSEVFFFKFSIYYNNFVMQGDQS